MKVLIATALAVTAATSLGSMSFPTDAEAQFRKQQVNTLRSTPPQLNCHTGFTKTVQEYYPANQHNGFARKLTCLSATLKCAKPTDPGLKLKTDRHFHDWDLSQGVFKILYRCGYLPTGAQVQAKTLSFAKAPIQKQQGPTLTTKPVALKCWTGFNAANQESYPANQYDGHPKLLDCLTPVIKCPKAPKPGLKLGVHLEPINVNDQQGTFKLKYSCEYN
ncbi:hypothetical protein [Pelagibius sp.]|uniref:hypothetical protein n=1 Tax=Pelagibius sp. TaxID=1931238 RepID=UPI0026204FAF|nr:hypothetical protein [Pelagibius sp.]